jgi:hypothetical protein
MQEQLPRHEVHEEKVKVKKLRVLPVFVVPNQSNYTDFLLKLSVYGSALFSGLSQIFNFRLAIRRNQFADNESRFAQLPKRLKR